MTRVHVHNFEASTKCPVPSRLSPRFFEGLRAQRRPGAPSVEKLGKLQKKIHKGVYLCFEIKWLNMEHKVPFWVGAKNCQTSQKGSLFLLISGKIAKNWQWGCLFWLRKIIAKKWQKRGDAARFFGIATINCFPALSLMIGPDF